MAQGAQPCPLAALPGQSIPISKEGEEVKLSPDIPDVLEGISLHRPLPRSVELNPDLWQLLGAGKGRALCSFPGW